MSALYNLEPQPTAKVLLTTTSGDLSLELFAKQTPLASRNFLQHCLDGYYENTIFHRLVPGFILQGGDPTGTGHGGESIYENQGGVFEDEFHSRLKFNRRGLLGMANGGAKNDNGSQFFLTLGETPELQGKHTMFGRVEGATIYNLMKMGEAELEPVEGSERPVYPTKITGAEILVNPFEDMVKRERSNLARAEKVEAKKKLKKKGGKTLLSFGGDEAEEGMEQPVLKRQKFNPTLVVANGDIEDAKEVKAPSKQSGRTVEKPVRRRTSRSKSPSPLSQPEPQSQLPLRNDEEPSRSPSSSPEPAQISKVTSLLDKTNAQIADLKASMKRTIQPAPAKEAPKKSALEQMIPETAMRGRKRKNGADGDSPIDKQTLKLLNAFKAKLEKAPPEVETSAAFEASKRDVHDDNKKTRNGNDEDEAVLCDLHFIADCQSCQSWDQQLGIDADTQDDDNAGWMSHALSFEKDRLGKDLNWKKKNEEELVVIDPREKEKTIKEEQRAKRLARMAGGTTAWDRDREDGRKKKTDF